MLSKVLSGETSNLSARINEMQAALEDYPALWGRGMIAGEPLFPPVARRVAEAAALTPPWSRRLQIPLEPRDCPGLPPGRPGCWRLGSRWGMEAAFISLVPFLEPRVIFHCRQHLPGQDSQAR